VRKVNIDTDLRMASTGAVRKHLIENTANFDPRKFLKDINWYAISLTHIAAMIVDDF
jgi:fructose/tagatose bisphosphate aldolase